MSTKSSNDIRKITPVALNENNDHGGCWPADYAKLKKWSNGQFDD